DSLIVSVILLLMLLILILLLVPTKVLWRWWFRSAAGGRALGTCRAVFGPRAGRFPGVDGGREERGVVARCARPAGSRSPPIARRVRRLIAIIPCTTCAAVLGSSNPCGSG